MSGVRSLAHSLVIVVSCGLALLLAACGGAPKELSSTAAADIMRGDTIRVDCAWNRERAPYEAVGYILWADGTGDEMCYSSITTMSLGN